MTFQSVLAMAQRMVPGLIGSGQRPSQNSSQESRRRPPVTQAPFADFKAGISLLLVL